jgi:hypothetical protein
MEKGLCKCGCGNKTRMASKTMTKRGWIKGKPIDYLKGHYPNKENHWNWNGGKTIIEGYPATIVYEDDDFQHYEMNHRLKAEKVLGYKLKFPHEMHHVDGNRLNYENNNLVICEDRKYHLLLHARQRAKNSCGNANYRKCAYCKKYDLLDNMTVFVFKKRIKDSFLSYRYYHNDCRKEFRRNRRLQGLSA